MNVDSRFQLNVCLVCDNSYLFELSEYQPNLEILRVVLKCLLFLFGI